MIGQRKKFACLVILDTLKLYVPLLLFHDDFHCVYCSEDNKKINCIRTSIQFLFIVYYNLSINLIYLKL